MELYIAIIDFGHTNTKGFSDIPNALQEKKKRNKPVMFINELSIISN